MFADENEFVFIGWQNNDPIIVNREIHWNSLQGVGDNLNIPYFILRSKVLQSFALYSLPYKLGLIDANGNRIQSQRGNVIQIVLDQLYKLPNIRNLSLYNTFYNNDYPNHTILLMSNYINNVNDLIYFKYEGHPTQERWYELNRDIITEIETRYPGLFEPIFVREEPDNTGVGGNRKRRIKKSTRRHIRRST